MSTSKKPRRRQATAAANNLPEEAIAADAAIQPELANLARQVAEHGQALERLKDVPETLQVILEKLQGPPPEDTEMIEQDDEFNEILNAIENSEADDTRDESDLSEIMASMDQKIEEGPPINEKLADGFTRAASTTLGKEMMDQIKERSHARVPANCTAIQVPRVNPEIWSILPVKGRVTDVKSQGLQQTMSIGLCSIANIANEMFVNTLIPKDVKTMLLKIAMDGAKALGSGFFELSMKRRNDMKSYINPEYSDICSSRHSVSDMLFGNNLADRLKESKNTSELIRKTSLKNIRPKPYSRPVSSSDRPGNLNFNRPSFQNFRRGGGRPPRFNRPFLQPQRNRQTQ